MSEIKSGSITDGGSQCSADPISKFLCQVRNLRDKWRKEDKDKQAENCGDNEFEPSQLWFRGVEDANYQLKPQVYRKTDYKLRKFHRKKPNQEEITHGFKSRGIQLMAEPRLADDEKGWYFLMQHYGAPTRLLDWTDGALLALYFAVRKLKDCRDVAVWVLDPKWLNKKAHKMPGVALPDWPETDPWFPKPFEQQELHPRSPLAIDPPHIARRVAVQRSHFTIHGTDQEGLDEMAKEEPSRLVKITIQAEDIIQVIDDLTTFGIVETTVFPDLEDLARELTREWGGDGE